MYVRGVEPKREEGLENDGSGLGNDSTDRGRFRVFSYYSYVANTPGGKTSRPYALSQAPCTSTRLISPAPGALLSLRAGYGPT